MNKILHLSEVGFILLDDSFEVLSSINLHEKAYLECFENLQNRKINPELLEKLSNILEKKYPVTVTDLKLMEILSNEGFTVLEASPELIKKIVLKKLDLIVKANLAIDRDDAREKIRNIAIQNVNSKLKKFLTRADLHIIESIQALDEVEKTTNVLAIRLREWYGLHFPELNSFIEDPKVYAKIVMEFGSRDCIEEEGLIKIGMPEDRAKSLMNLVKNSSGGEILKQDLERLIGLSDEVIRLLKLKSDLLDYIDRKMEVLAPNITSVIGSSIGARLIAKTGGLERLAMIPASKIQVLGAEKALYRALKTGTRPPKHGIIFQHKAIHSAPKILRGKIARSIATKVAIAARIDAFRGEIDKEMEKRLQERLDEIKEKYDRRSRKIKKSRRGEN